VTISGFDFYLLKKSNWQTFLINTNELKLKALRYKNY